MARYFYTAKSDPQKTIQGDIEAESEQDAIEKLTKLGYFPISVKSEEEAAGKPGAIKGKVSKREIVLFTRQLSTLLESGVNILDGLNIILGQITNKYFRMVITDTIARIKDGAPLSESLAEHERLFPSLYTSMIHSGEAGGTLEETLKRLADFMEKEEEFRNSVRAALTYPLFVFGVGLSTVMILLIFVIPRLVTMFEDMGQALPLPTKMLIDLSSFMRSYWWLIIAVIGSGIFFLRRSLRTAEGRIIFDRMKLKIYIFGDITLKTEISRMTRTLSVLLSGGVSVISALDLSISVIANQVLKEEMTKFKEKIGQGVNFSRCLKESNLFPPFVTNIVTVGEETGTLEKALMRIADEYERDVDRTLKNLSRMLEPVIILVMGLIVGFIVLSMLLPIFQINLIVK